MVPCLQRQTLVNAGNDTAACLVPFSIFSLIGFLFLMVVRLQLNRHFLPLAS
jgi:hypothetical protein